MFKLIRLAPNLFALKFAEFTAVGTYDEMVNYAVDGLKVSFDEIKSAIAEFDAQGHNTADFGVWLTWIYTSQEEHEFYRGENLARIA